MSLEAENWSADVFFDALNDAAEKIFFFNFSEKNWYKNLNFDKNQ